MTYDQIEKESKLILDLMMSSQREVPGFFKLFSRVKYHFAIYVISIVLSYITLPKESDVGIWFFILAFGVFHWFALFSFVFSFESLFSMIDPSMVLKFEICRLIERKVAVYGLVWFFVLLVLGGCSIFSEWNIIPLVVGNFIFTFFMFFIFNMDISRYQISGLFGAMAAAKEKLTQTNAGMGE